MTVRTGSRAASGRRRAAALAAAILAASPMPAAAGAECGGPTVAAGRLGAASIPPGTARPVAALAGRTAETGPGFVVLAGVLLPWAAGSALRAAAADEIAAYSDAQVAVHALRARLDRRGRIVGQVSTAEGEWLQRRLVVDGLAVAEADGSPCADALLAAEAEARQARRGLWAGPDVLTDARDFDPATLPDHVLMRGRVETVGMSGATTYLNFGGLYAEDATVRIAGREAADLAARGITLPDLAGRTVLVRGWADPDGGLDLRLATASGLTVEDGTEAR